MTIMTAEGDIRIFQLFYLATILSPVLISMLIGAIVLLNRKVFLKHIFPITKFLKSLVYSIASQLVLYLIFVVFYSYILPTEIKSMSFNIGYTVLFAFVICVGGVTLAIYYWGKCEVFMNNDLNKALQATACSGA